VFTQPAVATLNHLLTQSGWALQRLARFGGKTARFNIAPFAFACTIQEDGALREAAADVSADASCTIPPSLLPRLALRDENAFKQIESAGDAALLTEIFFLARNLRWDAAEDLSRVTGDIAAERIVQFAKAKQQQVHDTALNLSQALAEYWTEEHPLLAKPQQLVAFAQQVDGLRDEVEQLEQRIQQLSEAK
jgi:ubiquinone biosynthesis protein UbiJ